MVIGRLRSALLRHLVVVPFPVTVPRLGSRVTSPSLRLSGFLCEPNKDLPGYKCASAATRHRQPVELRVTRYPGS
eukprot:1762711-Rhodomonas_salina.1